MSDSDYLFDNAMLQAGDRFDALASLFDLVTFRHLERIGVAEGWRCWDVGAGGGSVARWLASRVGASGRVVATDLDVSWLENRLSAPNVEVRRHDVVDDPPPQPFDLVHERLVLLHVPARIAALDRLVSALRPGGWLLVEDFDSSVATDCFVDSQSEDEELGNRIMRGVRALLARRGADTALGHKLPRLLREAGLGDVGADGYQAIAGGDAIRRLQQANITQVSDQLIQHSLIARENLDRYLGLLDAGTVNPCSPFLVSAWGRRPVS